MFHVSQGACSSQRLERIGLYQLHRIDRTVALAEQIGALRQLREGDKIRHIGLSEVSVDQLAEVEAITTIATVQNRYSIADRASEGVLDYCGIAFIPWLPVARANTADAGLLGAIAARRESYPARPGLAAASFTGHGCDPGHILPDHLEENIAAMQLELGPDDYDQLSAST